jgi:NAD(P)-dependent dehydrogenase (short-subunit alcohol dehydrogenase family)
MQLKPIADQVVVIMGASSGIGRETALHFAQRGAKVVVSARSEPGLLSLVDKIKGMGGEATAVVADVAHFTQVQAVAKTAVEIYGRLDTWVHLASTSMWATFEQTTPEEFKRIIDVNLTGQAYGVMAALPHLRREGRGALIHISSVEARLPVPLQSAYAASKHGVAGLLDTLRLELRHEGVPISVTNIIPSGINTPLFNKARTKLGVKPRPLPIVYQPQLVVEAILYAAEYPIREITVGGAGKMFQLFRRMSPRMTDALLQRIAYPLQRTDDPKSEDAPDTLFEPIEGQDRIEGDFGGEAKSWSVYTWLATHPRLNRLAAGAAVGMIALLAVRGSRNGKS